MAEVNLFEFGDLVECGERLGYDYNQAHDILVNDEVPPMYEAKKREFYIGEINNNDYGYSEDTLKILKAFFREKNLEEFVII